MRYSIFKWFLYVREMPTYELLLDRLLGELPP